MNGMLFGFRVSRTLRGESAGMPWISSTYQVLEVCSEFLLPLISACLYAQSGRGVV